ncbi:MAG TPA: HYR domain-containing protein [Thermoanaerobaculia bacterium]|nr:HYR domain-containing protein [Thermoanaerobaculia bacterium]
MRHLLLVLLLSVSALADTRPVVLGYAPAQFVVASGERFMTIEGHNFMSGEHNPSVVFTGPDGPIELTASSMWPTATGMRIQVWVPQEIINTIGRYRVAVRNAVNGESDPFSIEVSGDSTIILRTPPYLSIEATGPSGEVVRYEASAESTTGAEVSLDCTPASGTTFVLGQHSVTCTGTTSNGASRSVTFPVSIYDRTPPVLTIPEDIYIAAVERDGAVVEFETSAVDTVDTDVPVTCSPASGTHFPMRTTEVRCSARDDSFNSTIRSFLVTVSDNAFPTLMLPADMVVEATSRSGAIVNYTATARDYVERTIAVECAPASGTFFPVGISTVSCTATDDMERSTNGVFRVTVNPYQEPPAPTLVVPQDFAVEATSAEGAIVTFTVTAFDYANRSLAVTCDPPSGTLFRIGPTTVACTATDDRNRSGGATFLVIVSEPRDSELPVLELPLDITVEATGEDGATVTYYATASDADRIPIDITCTPESGSLFPIGTTTVNCSATDRHDQTVTGSFKVIVTERQEDTTPPVILSIAATPNRLWPVNRRMVHVVVDVDAVDEGGGIVRARITSVAVSEAVSDTDWRIVDDLTVALRAARNGQEQPRTYTIVVEVSDSSGNISTGTVAVTVPHDGSDNGTTPQAPPRRRSARH